MPWNPMRVEQRIGRIDRLGQEYETIRIVNLQYEDTVETDVYLALRQRIQLFAKFVGKLQPILAKVPQQISEAVLRGPADEKERERRRLQIANDITAEQRKIEQQAFDLDAVTEADIEDPKRPDAPYSLDDLRRLMTIPELLPPEIEISDHAMKYATLRMAGLEQAVRITDDAEFFDEHPESTELWSPGTRVFPTPAGADQPARVKKLAELLDEAEGSSSGNQGEVTVSTHK
jgi:hypothetical protein